MRLDAGGRGGSLDRRIEKGECKDHQLDSVVEFSCFKFLNVVRDYLVMILSIITLNTL